jgi:hypothetical protein
LETGPKEDFKFHIFRTRPEALPIFADPNMGKKMCISFIYIYSTYKGLSLHIFVECLYTKMRKIRKIRKGRERANLPLEPEREKQEKAVAHRRNI